MVDTFFEVLAKLGGVAVVVVGLAGWLGKLWAQRIIMRETQQLSASYADAQKRLQARLDHVTFVSKTHFEAEFSNLRALWAAVVEARSAVSALRPMGDFKPEGETEAERNARYDQRHARLGKAIYELKALTLNLEPFVSTELFEAALDVAATADSEHTDYAIADSDARCRPDWFSTGSKNTLLVRRQAAKVATLIRDRLAAIASAPPTL